ncbi:MAG: ribonuclease III [Planctomycetota bacterium]
MSGKLNDKQLVLLDQCEQHIEYVFQDKQLLFEAVTHASVSESRLRSYERLEFLGDSILGFVVCEYLFERFPSWLEGDLTKIKSAVVSRRTCAKIGDQLELTEFLVVGKGLGSRGAIPDSLLANAFESIVGAIYLDGGIDAVKGFLLKHVKTQVDEAVAGRLSSNYKSELQQFSQKRFGMPPSYRLLGNRGPDHDKSFMVSAHIGKNRYPAAWGKNKKEAEQRAAANALAVIQETELPFPAEDEDEYFEKYEGDS